MPTDERTIAVFACRFAGDSEGMPAGALFGGRRGLRWARVPCGAVVHAGLILKALEEGARGVLVVTCAEAECHFREGTRRAAAACAKAAALLRLLGHDPERVRHANAGRGADPLALAEAYARDLEGMPAAGAGRRAVRSVHVEGARR